MPKLIILGELPTLNEMISQSKTGKYNYQPYAQVKKKYTEMIAWECKSQLKGKRFKKVDLVINWYCKNIKKDKDNVAVGIKYILDGLVVAKTIENDGWKQINNFTHKFYIDKDNPRVEVEISEVA